MHLHAYILPILSYTLSNIELDVSDRLALVLDIETLTETILCAQRKEGFVLGVQGGNVACATQM
jgi:hypothetical protein